MICNNNIEQKGLLKEKYNKVLFLIFYCPKIQNTQNKKNNNYLVRLFTFRYHYLMCKFGYLKILAVIIKVLNLEKGISVLRKSNKFK